MERYYIVCVQTNGNGHITAVNSSAFLTDTANWIEIDRGSGDRYHHAQGNYFPESIYTDGGAYRYKLVEGAAVKCTAEEIAAQEAALQPDPEEPEEDLSVWDELDAAYQSGYREGVDSV